MESITLKFTPEEWSDLVREIDLRKRTTIIELDIERTITIEIDFTEEKL